ncbi:unnamed protein product [Pleuronectes platessa]|uniref:Uncharacterized protein n=1 Tax=Pleuronectes platessa TaxID=8262 RepID=A0A9N7V4L7_PLEPL|nr:unnamed protein product [Pleuronectes platessa]
MHTVYSHEHKRDKKEQVLRQGGKIFTDVLTGHQHATISPGAADGQSTMTDERDRDRDINLLVERVGARSAEKLQVQQGEASGRQGLLRHHGSTEDMFEQLTRGHESGYSNSNSMELSGSSYRIVSKIQIQKTDTDSISPSTPIANLGDTPVAQACLFHTVPQPPISGTQRGRGDGFITDCEN